MLGKQIVRMGDRTIGIMSNCGLRY